MMTSTDQQPPVPTASAAVLSDEDEAVRQTLLNAAHLWSSFDLTSRRPQLAQTATQAKENRELSQSARKLLGEQTKRFKKSVKSTEAAASSLSTLASSIAGSDDLSEGASAAVHAIELLAKEGRSTIKSYQEEIDNLTRRCKFADGAFAGLQGALADLPDPAGVLPAAVGRIEEAAASTDRLRSELREAGVEIDALREEVDLLREEQKRRDEEGSSAESGRDNEGADESQKQSSSSGLGKPEREELLQLRREVAEYEVEFRSLQNQDITIRKLEARIVELQRSSEEEFADRMERFQREIEEEQGRRVADALEREAATERRCAGLELELKAERAGRHATQNRLFEQGEGLGEREAAWEAQRSILVDDAERLREALHDATRERDELRLRAAALESASSSSRGKKSAEGSDPATPVIHASPSQDSEDGGASSGPRSPDMALERRAYEAEVSELTETNAALRQELRASEEAAAAERATLRAKISTLEGERDDAEARALALADEVSSMPSAKSIEAMRRELRVLKRLEYNASDADGLEDHSKDPEMTTTTAAAVAGASSSTGDERDLETVLVDRLRKAEADLLRERREKAEGEDRGRELARQLSSLRKEKAEADDLVARLESDLHRAIATPAAQGVGGASAVTSSSSVPLPSSGGDPAALQRILDPTGAPSPVAAAAVAPKAAPPAPSEKDNDDHSVVTIVMAQRDRLRARCDALEAERDGFKRELQEQVRSADSLKADNTKLYEKVRYLQNYASKQPGGGGGHNNPVGSRTSDLDLEALEERYEASVDPFRQFSRAERQRKLREMSPMERIVFVTAKTVLATKQLRAALFFYVLGMHLLVFITTHHWSHGSTNCHAALNEHPDFAHLHHGVPILEEATPPLPPDGGVGGVN